MSETIITQPTMEPEPELRRKAIDPKGVLQKNIKPLMYLGAAGLVIVAAILSAHTKPTSNKPSAAQHQPPQPVVQDNTDNNVQDLKNQLAAERQKAAQQAAANDVSLAGAMPAQRSVAAGYGPTGQRSGPTMPTNQHLCDARTTTTQPGATAGTAARRQRPRACL
jgi:type IV secretion system protein TrbI